MGIQVNCFPYGMYGENTYLITDEASGMKAVIDPGYYGSEVITYIPKADKLKYLLLTHGHHDHFYAVPDYLKNYPDVEFAAPADEKAIMKQCPDAHTLLKEGDCITLGDTKLKVISTPGHTGAGICFATDKEIFTGDTLFRLSVGRTDLPTGDWNTLIKSIKEKLYTLNEDMIVYPGHGEPTTIGFEKRSNPFV